MTRAVRQHLEMEKLFGIDAIPKGRRSEPPGAEWEEFKAQVMACTRCGLAQGRRHVVFGVGPLNAPLAFVGEAPGEEEDRRGEPFVGRSGQLLTRLLKEVGVSREQVWIGNIIKCRPPDNRLPTLEEIRACIPHLLRQLKRINPRVICTLGLPSTKTLLNTTKSMSELRGKIAEAYGAKIYPTYHPAFILRAMNNLPVLKEDLRKACRMAGLI